MKEFKGNVAAQDPCPRDDENGAADNQRSEQEGTVTTTVHPKAIRPVGALHFTLGVMSLDTEKLERATRVLRELDVQDLLRGALRESNQSEGSKPGDGDETNIQDPLKIDLKGLQSMHAPHKTSILYTGPQDSSSRLHPFCLALQKKFKEHGFLVEDSRPLKLHATVVNTIYAKGRKMEPRKMHSSETKAGGSQYSSGANSTEDRSQGHGPNANAPLKIDASEILEKYADFVWAENVTIDRVSICEMGTKKILDDRDDVKGEEYLEVACVALPS